MADYARLSDKRFDGYLKKPIPHALDDVVARFIDELTTMSKEGREAVREHVDLSGAQVLNVYAERMAVAAVRLRAQNLLDRALIAIATAGAVDYRENLMVLALIDHSAGLLGTTLEQVILRVADYLPSVALDRMQKYCEREPSERAIRRMGYAAQGHGSEFRYVRASPWDDS